MTEVSGHVTWRATVLLLVATLAVLVCTHTSAASTNKSSTTSELMFMEGESMPANLVSATPDSTLPTSTVPSESGSGVSSTSLPVLSSSSSSSSPPDNATSEALHPKAIEEVGDMMLSKEPLEVADMNKDPYRNTTEADAQIAVVEATTAGVTVPADHVTLPSDDVTPVSVNRTATTPHGETTVTDHVTLPSHDVTPVSVNRTATTPDGETTVTEYTEAPPSQPALVLVVQHGDHGHTDNGKTAPFSQPTEAAAIMAGVLVSLAVAGYVGLVTWRKLLERRYNNREMLVNEDDEDLSHFEL